MGRKLNLTPALIQCILNNMTVGDGGYVFTPLRLTVLESMAEELCKSAHSFTKMSADGKEENERTDSANGS